MNNWNILISFCFVLFFVFFKVVLRFFVADGFFSLL